MNNPIITAFGAIPAYACVKVSTSGSERVEVATSAADVVFGVTLAAETANGGAVDFQTTDSQLDIFTLKAAGTIAIGQYVVPTTNGAVIGATTGPFVALDPATIGQTFTARKFNAGATANFLAPGTGAVTRTLDAKLSDMVSVKDFGAVGDGVADDTVAIQAALNSGAIYVYCPKGTYKTTATLFIPNRVSLEGAGKGSVIQATSISGAAISTFEGTFVSPGFNENQHLRNICIGGTCTTALLWTCSIKGSVENITIKSTSTHGVIVDGSFNCRFAQIETYQATISNVCFWAGRAFNANHVDGLHTSNFCSVNFLCNGLSSLLSPLSPFNESGENGGSGNTLTNACIQGGNIGMNFLNTGFGAWTINSPYFENVALPIQLGDATAGDQQLCRSVTFNSIFLLGRTTATHPGGASVVGINILNAINVTFNATEFGEFADTGCDPIRYRKSHKVLFNGFFFINGGVGSTITNKIKRIISPAGGDSDGGVMVIGEEAGVTLGSRAHFILMKSKDFGFNHWKMEVNSSGAWQSIAATPTAVS